MAGIGGKHSFEIGERVAHPAELQERDAAPVEKFSVVWLDLKARVVACERVLESAQGMKHKPEAGKPVGAPEVRLQRRLQERKGRVETPKSILDLPETVQRIEIIGTMMQQGAEEPLRLIEIAIFVSMQRAPA
jgi:hypothetical protein